MTLYNLILSTKSNYCFWINSYENKNIKKFYNIVSYFKVNKIKIEFKLNKNNIIKIKLKFNKKNLRNL